MSNSSGPLPPTRPTPLRSLHAELGGKLVDFAGWALPVHFPTGIMAEHRHCRTAAALFDVSHMAQVLIRGNGAAEAFERLGPAGQGRMEHGASATTLVLVAGLEYTDERPVGVVVDVDPHEPEGPQRHKDGLERE